MGPREPRTPELGPNKFQERPFGACRMQENLLAARAVPQTPLGEPTALLQPLAGGEGTGCPLSKDPTPAPSPLT